MATLETRLAKLEETSPWQHPLVLLEPKDGLSEEQRQQVAEAERQGRRVLIVRRELVRP
jgi:hypothetical protein